MPSISTSNPTDLSAVVKVLEQSREIADESLFRQRQILEQLAIQTGEHNIDPEDE